MDPPGLAEGGIVRSQRTGTDPGRRLWRAFCAVAAFGLVAVAAWRYRDWVEDAATALAAAPERGDRAAPDLVTGTLARYDMAPGLAYGPASLVRFGDASAWMRVATSPEPPEDVFRRTVMSQRGRRGLDPMRLVFSADRLSAIFRGQSQIGVVGGVPFLLRLPIDAHAARKERVAVEPGALTFAFSQGDVWDYVFFHFPEGLRLEDLTGDAARARALLAPLGVAFSRFLSPQYALDFGRAEAGPSPGTVLCRTEGDAREAFASAMEGLQEDGWHVEKQGPEPPGTHAFRVAKEGTEAWIRGELNEADEAWVTVVIAGR